MTRRSAGSRGLRPWRLRWSNASGSPSRGWTAGLRAASPVVAGWSVFVIAGLVGVVVAGLVVTRLVVVVVQSRPGRGRDPPALLWSQGLRGRGHRRRHDVAGALPPASGRERVRARGERQYERAQSNRRPLHSIHLLVMSGSPPIVGGA